MARNAASTSDPTDGPNPRDPVAHAGSTVPSNLAELRYAAPRQIAHAEEGEGGRGEWWALLKAVVIGALIVMLIGWLISG
ncbi:hypothetical protein SAMN02745194_01108 [Roseomonas rosea]|uniref:Uncharacterized protein n=1 Tax=Muricoccus roseus TaxID=198092 RepID=A0A1M6E4Z7_9PROT|nr:hypothetical protein [Roseomonas rosea]SHI80440.1 hypothetical protein SAMN02745194_01108 [Roseomonas rosea]